MPIIDGVDITTHVCTPQRPCRRFRHCARCARWRQKLIADATERLAAACGTLRWHIIYPAEKGQDAIRKEREKWLRNANPPGAIWTIEQSATPGALHCNIITPATTLHTPKTAAYWQQTIAGDVRAVGAYISKRRQMPTEQQYTGKLWGTAGRLWDILTGQREAPVVAAAAAQYALDSHAMRNAVAQAALTEAQRNRWKWEAERQRQAQKAVMTRADARAIAQKYLPDLLEFKEKNRQRSALEIARENHKRESEI